MIAIDGSKVEVPNSKENRETFGNSGNQHSKTSQVRVLITVQTDISLSEIADHLGVSYKTVQRTIADLKRVGAIERIGGRKKGDWKVSEIYCSIPS